MILNRFRSNYYRGSIAILKLEIRNKESLRSKESSLSSSHFAFIRATHYASCTNRSRYVFQRSSTNMEVCHPVIVTTGIAWHTFTNASFHFRTGPTSGSLAQLVRVTSRVRSLSLSVNLKSNYTRLRSQAVTQFVVILGTSISATA